MKTAHSKSERSSGSWNSDPRSAELVSVSGRAELMDGRMHDDTWLKKSRVTRVFLAL